MTLSTAVDPLTSAQGVFLQYGAIGAILLVLLVFAYGAIKRERDATDRERDRAKEAEKALADLNALMRTEVIPVLTKAAEATTRVTDVIGRVTDVLAEVSAVLRDRR
jgi:hypothetical protein